MLTPEVRREIREKVYPFSEAIPINDVEEQVDEVQIKTADAALEQVVALLKRDYVIGRDSSVLVKDIRKLKSK